MSLYSSNFTFLPRPERSFLSWGNEETRLILPDFESVQELSQFVLRLFDFQFQVPNIDLQLKIGIGFECLVFFLSFLIVSRRIYEGNFWLFRLIATSTGSIIVPNTMLSFLITEAIFKGVFIAFLWEFSRYSNMNSDGPPNIVLWVLLPWCALIYGAFMAAVGTYYATPNGVRHRIKNKHQHSNILKRIFLHAWTANFISFSIPTISCISVTIPAFISNAHFMQVRFEQIQWLTNYSQEIQFTQEMVTDVQMIWFTSLHAIKLTSITYLMWFGWAMICFLVYTFFSIRLIKTILVEMKKTKMEEMEFLATTFQLPIQDEFSIEEEQKQDFPTNHFPFIKTIDGKQTIFGLSEIDEGLEMDEMQKRERHSSQSPSISPFEGQLTNKESDQTLQSTSSNDHFTSPKKKEEQNKKSKPTKFSNLIMNQKYMNERAKEVKLLSINEQKRQLKKAAINIFVQATFISPGCAILAGIALYMAFAVYGGYEQPLLTSSPSGYGTYFERYTGIGLLWALYSIVLLGLYLFGCLFFRVYESVFIEKQTDQPVQIQPSPIISKNSSKFNQRRSSFPV